MTSNIVVAGFLVMNKLGKAIFFQKTFLLADITINMVLRMSFLTFNNAEIQFAKKKLI